MSQLKASMHIGGQLELSLVPKFCTLIDQNMPSLEFGGAPFKPSVAEDLLGACKADIDTGIKTLCLFTNDAAIGGFPLIEIFLLHHKLDYTLKSEGDTIYCPFLVEYRGYCDFYLKTKTNARFENVLNTQDINAIMQESTNKEELEQLLQDIMPETPQITQFSVKVPQLE